jgi:Mg-chelatase subunit ChlD
MSRTAAAASGRRDAYSVILFNESPSCVVENDYTSNAKGLLSHCLDVTAEGGTDFGEALQAAQTVMGDHVSLQIVSRPDCWDIFPTCAR